MIIVLSCPAVSLFKKDWIGNTFIFLPYFEFSRLIVFNMNFSCKSGSNRIVNKYRIYRRNIHPIVGASPSSNSSFKYLNKILDFPTLDSPRKQTLTPFDISNRGGAVELVLFALPNSIVKKGKN
jgi:hypothetical protein